MIPQIKIQFLLPFSILYITSTLHTEYLLVEQASLKPLQLFSFVFWESSRSLSAPQTHTHMRLGLGGLISASHRIEIDRHHRLKPESVPLSRTLSQSLPKNLASYFYLRIKEEQVKDERGEVEIIANLIDK